MKLFATATLASYQEKRIETLEAEKVALQGDLASARQRIDELTNTIVHMKKKDFEVVPAPPKPVEVQSFHPEIEAALAAVDEPELREIVAAWVGDKMPVAETVAMIYRGGSVPL